MSNQSAKPITTYVPREISMYANLNISEMRVLAIITGLHKKNGCNAKNQKFADKAGLSVSQVSRIIKSLTEKGYIQVNNPKSFNREIKPINQQQEQVQEPQTEEATKEQEVPVPKVADKVPAQQEENKVVSLSSKKNNTCKPGYKSGNKNNTGKSNAEKGKFFSGYSHEFNFNQLEELETQYVANQLGEIHHNDISDRAKELLSKIHIDEEPSEWLGVNQLKI